MPVIIGEAGGRFTDIGGTERIDGGSGVATNGRIHDEVLGLLAPERIASRRAPGTSDR
jgi:histidinol-phosphatase